MRALLATGVICLVLLSKTFAVCPGALTTLMGEAADNEFGWAVANVGDMNGDGKKEFAVSAYEYGSDTGRVYVYSGANSSQVLYKITGQAAANFFGTAVSTAGDFNGDGLADIVISAPGYNSGVGRVYVFFGRTGSYPISILADSANRIYTGNTANTGFGNSVSGGGNVNACLTSIDEEMNVTEFCYDDIIVGQPSYDVPYTNTGRAYLFFGSSSQTLSPITASTAYVANSTQMIVDSPDSATQGIGEEFGTSVGMLEDHSSDGRNDFIISAWKAKNPNLNDGDEDGQAYIFKVNGSLSSPTISISHTFLGKKFSYMGSSVGSAGDVNNDGTEDILLSASFDVNAGSLTTGAGSVEVYSGVSPFTQLLLRHEGNVIDSSEYLGYSAGPAGDVNGDGHDDIWVSTKRRQLDGTFSAIILVSGDSLHGAFFNDGDGYCRGIIQGFYLDVDLPASVAVPLYASAASVADYNSDGIVDFAIGSYNANDDSGRVDIYSIPTMRASTCGRGVVGDSYSSSGNFLYADCGIEDGFACSDLGSYILYSGDAPLCMDEADFDRNGSVNFSDYVLYLTWITYVTDGTTNYNQPLSLPFCNCNH